MIVWYTAVAVTSYQTSSKSVQLFLKRIVRKDGKADERTDMDTLVSGNFVKIVQEGSLTDTRCKKICLHIISNTQENL